MKNKLEIHAKAITIALAFASVAAFIQPISGDLAAKKRCQAATCKTGCFRVAF